MPLSKRATEFGVLDRPLFGICESPSGGTINLLGRMQVVRQGLAGDSCDASLKKQGLDWEQMELTRPKPYSQKEALACIASLYAHLLQTDSIGGAWFANAHPRQHLGRMRRQRQEADPAEVDDDDVPLHHKRAFGSGIKRKRVEFVRASDPDHGRIEAVNTSKKIDVGDLYASIVLGGQGSGAPSSTNSEVAAKKSHTNTTAAHEGNKSRQREEDGTSQQAQPSASLADDVVPGAALVCAICSLPITSGIREHEASLAHQVSLAHSHPPSALDRSRMGLRTLAAQGWDPDARQGLGREGEGLRFPIKTVAKEDNLGIGATKPEPGVAAAVEREKPKKLSAKEKLELAEREKKRAQRLQGEIFGSVDVERYLRGNGQTWS
ncbi:vacuolar calcium ion transporter [Paramyrothecium foliicola]|nr:vacuolar calcium ion transporter [Paramyrothecium foliicola]